MAIVNVGDVVTRSTYQTLEARIAVEAARRGVSVSVSQPAVAGQPITAGSFNSYRTAIMSLNTQNAALVFPSAAHPLTSIVTAYDINLLDALLFELENELLRCYFPRNTLITASTSNGSATFIINSSNVVTVNSLSYYNTYCSSSWRTATSGTVSGISIVTNSHGQPAERISITWQYRRGCGCGNDQTVQVVETITALCSPVGTEIFVTAGAISQWGC